MDCSWFAPRPFRETPSPLELLCVGRLFGEKAQAVLIAALDRLVREGRDLRLRLVGDGPDRPGLVRDVATRGLQSRVVFEGWLNQVRLREVYERVGIFVLPSFAEGLPVVLMEPMALEILCPSAGNWGWPAANASCGTMTPRSMSSGWPASSRRGAPCLKNLGARAHDSSAPGPVARLSRHPSTATQMID